MRRSKAVKNFDYYIDEYMYDCRSRRLRPKSMQSYEQTLRLFEKWCLLEEGIHEPSEVTESTIRHYICDLQDRGKYTLYSNDSKKEVNYPDRRRDFRHEISITTINNYIRNLKAFFGWYEYETDSDNPMKRIRQLRNERAPKEYLTDEEIEKLRKGFDLSYFSEHRDYTILMLILDSGMRIGECLGIEIKDINLTDRTILLPAEHTKGRKGRYVFYSVKMARILQKWLRFKDRYCESDLLFCVKKGTPLGIRNFESNMRKYLARVGIEKAFSPHSLRNNFARRALMAGMDVYTLSKILGHSAISVTEKAYMDLTDADLKKRYQNYSPLENLR